MPATTALHIPKPCHESWAAMTPTATGRHCAACAKIVVDFTLKTDAEILAYLAGAAAGRTCGRFAAGQLERPLQRAAPVAPAARWRAWLAAIIAVWGVRESVADEAKAQTATEWRARYWGGPVPAAPSVTETQKLLVPNDDLPTFRQLMMGDTVVVANLVAAPQATTVAPEVVFQGAVTDVSTNQGLPGVTILVKGTELGISTSADGTFKLKVPMQVLHDGVLCLTVSSVGFVTQERMLICRDANSGQLFQLPPATMGQLEMMVLPPAPWHPRAFYNWGKYWLTRPFRRS